MNSIPVEIQRFFKAGRLHVFPRKLSQKLKVLTFISEAFELNTSYSETEVNLIIGQYYQDTATIRRALCDYHFLARDDYGRQYWKLEKTPLSPLDFGGNSASN